jgi:hypothetical protein
MTSFGSWYEQQQRASENGDHTTTTATDGNSSLFFSSFGIDSEQVLPLFNSENMPGFSFESMKQSMEAQMPKKILGMGYQQRFKVSQVESYRKRARNHGTGFNFLAFCLFLTWVHLFFVLFPLLLDVRYFVPYFFCQHYSLRWPFL